MKFAKPEHSKTSVRKAGKLISTIDYTKSLIEYIDASLIFSNWRASHAYPMQSMLIYFRNKAFEVDANSITVQRLKRTPSIISKLNREEGMKLDRMEDIAGCRIVASTLNHAYKIKEKILAGRTRNILYRERDYIQTPKASGYRGIHLIYKYNGSKKEYQGIALELQIRSKLQHAWATTVEVVGTFTGEALKASRGNEDWLEFFKLASEAFANTESQDIKQYDYESLKTVEKKLNVRTKLKAFSISTQHLGKDIANTYKFYILVLNTIERRVTIKKFKQQELQTATDTYTALEKEHVEDPHIDVVLVSASSLQGLKKAYPNYFADTSEFIKTLEKILSKEKSAPSGITVRGLSVRGLSVKGLSVKGLASNDTSDNNQNIEHEIKLISSDQEEQEK
jgi:ppGpp synthetase/RelA/SpoT-type nucleotidyltranferase